MVAGGNDTIEQSSILPSVLFFRHASFRKGPTVGDTNFVGLHSSSNIHHEPPGVGGSVMQARWAVGARASDIMVWLRLINVIPWVAPHDCAPQKNGKMMRVYSGAMYSTPSDPGSKNINTFLGF